MSAVPASAQQAALVLERRAHLGDLEALALEQPQQQARVDRPRARRHDEPLERGEAHRRVDGAPVADRGERRAGAEVRRHDPRGRRSSPPRAATRRRARGRGSRSGGRPSARATRAGPRTSSPPGRASRGRPCRSTRRSGVSGSAASTASSAASDFGWCSGARSVSARSSRTTPSSTRTGRPEALAAVDDPVADGVDRPGAGDPRRAARPRRPASAGRRCRPRRRPRRPASSTRSLRLLDPALTTRTRNAPRSARRQHPVAHVGAVVAELARVGAVAQALVDHVLAQLRRPLAEPGTRSTTSITRWKRSMSLSMTMSNGVVVVPSSM